MTNIILPQWFRKTLEAHKLWLECQLKIKDEIKKVDVGAEKYFVRNDLTQKEKHDYLVEKYTNIFDRFSNEARKEENRTKRICLAFASAVKKWEMINRSMLDYDAGQVQCTFCHISRVGESVDCDVCELASAGFRCISESESERSLFEEYDDLVNVAVLKEPRAVTIRDIKDKETKEGLLGKSRQIVTAIKAAEKEWMFYNSVE